MTLALVTQLAVIAALAVLTGLLVRLVGGADPVVPVSPAVRTVVHGAALGGPWLLYFGGLLPAPAGLEGLLGPLALSWALYVLALWAVGGDTGRCAWTAPAGRDGVDRGGS